MTTDDAGKVINIMNKADGKCWFCSRALILYFITEFPEYESLAKQKHENFYKDRIDHRGWHKDREER